eukprot:scpid12874/ scgid10819/ Uncharacterized protein UNK4.17
MMSSAKETVRVGFIGGGAVNFGGAEGPWDHASRLENIPGLRVVAIADKLPGRAQFVLDIRKSGENASVYRECTAYEDYKLMLQQEKLDAVFIGVPPFAHGHFDSPIELDCVRAGVHCFVEKPLSVKPVAEVDAYMQAVLEEQKRQNLVVSVGYMFRYHPAIRRMKQLLADHESSTSARLTYLQLTYNCAYSQLDHPFWWRKELSGGPIVEQATHFCDIARYIGGDVLESSIEALCTGDTHPSGAGKLSAVPDAVREGDIASENRIPRLTVAHWRHSNGAIGQLSHGVALHHKRYEARIEVWADGLRVTVEDCYTPNCRLSFRQGDTDVETVETYPSADPYQEEDDVFIDAIRTGSSKSVQSPYEDALRTYALSWAVRQASESSANQA